MWKARWTPGIQKPQADRLVMVCEGYTAGIPATYVCVPTFAVRHLHRPGAVERIRVKVWEARREKGPCLSIDISSTKGCRDQERDTENKDSDSSDLKGVKLSQNH